MEYVLHSMELFRVKLTTADVFVPSGQTGLLKLWLLSSKGEPGDTLHFVIQFFIFL